MMKRTMAALLAAMLLAGLLAGCKPEQKDALNTPAEPLSAGRYVESEIDLPLPEGRSGQFILGVHSVDGELMVFSSVNLGEAENWANRYYRHTIQPDGTVSTAEEPWLNELAPFGGNEMHVAASQDGGLYMCYSDYDAEGNSVAHLLTSLDDGKTGAELTGDGIKSLDMLTSFGIPDGGFATGNFYDGLLLLLDQDGNRVQELTSGQKGPISMCAANGGYVTFTVPEGKLVRLYNQLDQSYLDYPYSFKEQDMAQLAVAQDGTVYLADGTGIYRHSLGGAIWEKLVDGATATIGLPDFYAGLLFASAEDPYPTFYVSNGETLLRYAYDPDAVAAADKELTVFSLRENDTVRQAIVAFSRTRGDVKVTYTVAMDGAAGGTEQDYIKALNTELLAGTGPDILILDGLPVDSYIEKDVLLDLTDIVAGAEPMLANLLDAYAVPEGLYAAPTGFTIPLAVAVPGTEGAFDSLSALADAAEQPGELPLLSPCAFSYKTLAQYLLQYYGGALESGDAGAVRTFLTDAGRISAAIGCTDALGEGWDALKEMSQDELYEAFSGYIASPQIFACASGLAQDALTQPVGSVHAAMETLELARQRSASIVSVGGQYQPVGVVGVNKAGREPEAAGSFVQTLLSYDAQGGGVFADQFPVNERALGEMLDTQNDNVSSGMNLNDGGEFTATWPDQAMRDRLRELIAALDAPMAQDAALRDMLLPEIEAYLAGSSTAEQAAERMTSLLSTYLSE